MEIDEYKSSIADVRFGKRVGTSIYFHRTCIEKLPSVLKRLALEAIQLAERSGLRSDVIKLDTRMPIVSLLEYPGFFDEAFPTLTRSATWDSSTTALNFRTYSNLESSPVLHRKELLLPVNHEKIDEFAALTELAEQLGLFADQSRIGRYGYWKSLLDEHAIRIVGHSIRRTDGQTINFQPTEIDVLRYKTALKRNRLSVPIQVLYKHGLLDENITLFDYGCGRGDDVRQLIDLGIDAKGWDPHFAPYEKKCRADVVNLGYVVNVIEDMGERQKVIAEAFSLARTVVAISALTGAMNYSGSVRRYKDGVITSAGTFQRYYQATELAELIRSSIDVDPISAAPGIMFVFADKGKEQAFMASRISRRQSRARKPTIQSLRELSDQTRKQAAEYWHACVELGRPVEKDEVNSCDELFNVLPSATKLFDLVVKDNNAAEFETASRSRKEELLVEFAMARFGRRLYFKYFSEGLKRDIRFHFGGYKNLTQASEQLLYSIADTDALLDACVDATDDGVGFLMDDHSLQLHVSLLDRLSPILRVYVGCAGLLYGDWSQLDLVKVHIQTGKVSFMGYDDFEGRPVPDLLERIKVKLWERDVDFFDYIGQFTPTPLFMKSLYIDESFEFFDEQSNFDKELMRTRLFDFMRERVSREQFYSALARADYRIEGYELVSAA